MPPTTTGYTFRAEAEHSKVVPSELAETAHWVTWLYEEIESKAGERKTTKIPYNPKTGRKASSTDPATWGTLQEAYTARAKYGHSGVGFVVTEADRIVGIDLDHCVDPATGEIADWAVGVITTLDSYSEISPSGAGVRIFCRGDLPVGRRKRGDVEMYSWGRFLTVTANHIPYTPRSVVERTGQIALVHKQFLGGGSLTAPMFADAPTNGNGKHPPNLSTPNGSEAYTLNWDASLTTRQLKALEDAHPKFGATWDMDRKKEHPRWTVSEYQMALASIMASLRCTPQQIADALIAHRLQHGEDLKHEAYYEHTIRTAYVQLATETAGARIAAAALEPSEQDSPDPAHRDQLIQDIATKLQFPFVGLIQYRTEQATYLLRTALGDVLVPNTNALTSQRLFRNLVFEATRIWPRGTDKEEWEGICRVLAQICEVEDLPQGTVVGAMSEWIAGYLLDNKPVQPPDESKGYPDEAIAKRMRPFVKGGQTHIFLESLKDWIKTSRGEIKTQRELATMLRRYGATGKTIAISGARTSRLVWVLPGEESTDAG